MRALAAIAGLVAITMAALPVPSPAPATESTAPELAFARGDGACPFATDGEATWRPTASGARDGAAVAEVR